MNNKKWLILIIIGIILILSALSLQIYNYYVDERAGKESKEVVEKIHKELKETSENKETLKIDGNEYIGIIEIPKLKLELPVMSDWSYKKMKISPGLYYGDINTDDLVICAHSYKNLFRYIKDLNKEDLLIYTDMNGEKYLYQVEVIEILSPEDIKEMIESEFDLTLFTCTDDNQDRVTVRFNKVTK